MRNMVLAVALALAAGGCATFNRSGGESGGAAVSGENKTPSSESGAAYDNIATSGSNPSEPTGPVH